MPGDLHTSALPVQPESLAESQVRLLSESQIRSLGETQEISLREYGFILQRRWPLLIWTTMLFILGGVFYTASQPKIYQSTAMIAITPPQAKRIGEIEVESASSAMGRDSFINTQTSILKSRTLAKKTLAKIPEPILQEFFGAADQKKPIVITEESIISCTEAQPQKMSDLVQIRCTGKHPQHCALIANLLVDTFIEDNEQQVNSTQNVLVTWLKQEIPNLEQKMLKNHEELSKFEESNLEIILSSNKDGVVFYSDILDRARQELQDVKMKQLSMEFRYRQCQTVRQNKNLEAFLALEFFEENPLLQRLRQQKLDLETQCDEYTFKYQPSHPRMIWAKQSLARLDQRIWQEAQLILSREEESYKNLEEKKINLEKIVQEQLGKSVGLKQRFVEYERLRREHESLQKSYNSMIDKMKELDITATYRTGNIRRIDPAEPSPSPYKPKKLSNYLLSALLGIMTGFGLILLLENLDESLKNIDDIQRLIPAPVLGSVPYISPKLFTKPPAMAVNEKDRSTVAESFRSISTALFLRDQSQFTHRLVVSSAVPGDGKSTIVCNLAFTLAKAGKTLLIDGDLRKPRLKATLQMKDGPGFADLLCKTASLEQVIQPVVDNLWAIPAGTIPPDPYQCIANSKLQELLDTIQQQYPYILLDSPPMGVASDAFLFAKATQNLILVISTEHMHKKMLEQLYRRLQTLQLSIQGVILNNIQERNRHSSYHYGNYGYGYYQSYKDYYHEEQGKK